MANKKSVLIISTPGDMHACAVDFCLKNMGVDSHIIEIESIFTRSGLSAYIDSNLDTFLKIDSFQGIIKNIGSSWIRCVPHAYDHSKFIEESDIQYVRKNSDFIMRGILTLLDQTFSVNGVSAVFHSSNKLRQLSLAKKAGLAIPRTLISNNYDDIIDFISSNHKTCVKPYASHNWVNNEGSYSPNTAIIDISTIDDRRSVEISPHIYQSFISKEYEYRLVIFGSYSACTRISTKYIDGKGGIDWRSNFKYLKYIENFQLPHEIEEKCRSLLKYLGLKFGAFDLAQDAECNYYFFEVNSSGQWLWQELNCSDCKILGPFAEYLFLAKGGYSCHKNSMWNKFSASDVVKAVQSSKEYEHFLESKQDNSIISFE